MYIVQTKNLIRNKTIVMMGNITIYFTNSKLIKCTIFFSNNHMQSNRSSCDSSLKINLIMICFLLFFAEGESWKVNTDLMQIYQGWKLKMISFTRGREKFQTESIWVTWPKEMTRFKYFAQGFCNGMVDNPLSLEQSNPMHKEIFSTLFEKSVRV